MHIYVCPTYIAILIENNASGYLLLQAEGHAYGCANHLYEPKSNTRVLSTYMTFRGIPSNFIWRPNNFRTEGA